jgi:ribulose-5-phosphate 4-epimerase/fuculose-1-phosphate aldolase
LYTWGTTAAEAARHIEILEFLLESVARSKEAESWRS